MILLKFNEDLWHINDNETSLPKTQEVADKMITITSTITSLPLLQLSQWPCKPNSKKCPKLTCQFEASSSSSSSKKIIQQKPPNSTPLITFYLKYPALPHLFISNLPIQLYPIYPSLPHKCNYSTKSSYMLQQCPNETSKSTRLIKFYSDYSTQPQLSHSILPFALYPTQHILSNSSQKI